MQKCEANKRLASLWREETSILLLTDDLPQGNPEGKSRPRAAAIGLIMKWLSWACLMVLHHKLMDLRVYQYISGLWWLAVSLLGLWWLAVSLWGLCWLAELVLGLQAPAVLALGLQALAVLGLDLLVEWGCDKYIKKLGFFFLLFGSK